MFFQILFCGKIHHFATWSKKLFGKIPNKLPHFEEESYEVAKFPSFEIPYLTKRF
jgi:hypothetical protein